MTHLPVYDLPTMDAGEGFDLLAGTTVLDLTTSIAGPYASLMLADMGAEIIKVERPGAGDDVRHWGPPFLDGESLWFLSVNRNKRSITLNIRSDEGRQVLHRLVEQSDVVMTNLTGAAQQRLGIDYASLRELNTKMVFVAITGFGLEGRRADWACYDLTAEGYSGVMDLTGDADGEPQKVGTPAADMLAGMDAAFATLAALYDRARTGRGHKIDISMVESMTRFLTPRLVSYLGSGDVPRRSGGKDSVIAIYQAFETADEPITLGLGNDNIWRRFWQVVGRPERADNPDLSDNAKRRQRRAEIVGEIQEILRARPRREWLAAFSEARVPAGPINRLDEVSADPDLLERRLFFAVRAGDRVVPQVNTGIHLDGRANNPRLAPRLLGQDTEAVLAERLGFDGATIADLRARKVI